MSSRHSRRSILSDASSVWSPITFASLTSPESSPGRRIKKQLVVNINQNQPPESPWQTEKRQRGLLIQGIQVLLDSLKQAVWRVCRAIRKTMEKQERYVKEHRLEAVVNTTNKLRAMEEERTKIIKAIDYLQKLRIELKMELEDTIPVLERQQQQQSAPQLESVILVHDELPSLDSISRQVQRILDQPETTLDKTTTTT
mmetsp:Transcript_18220/g.49699  ORF Transcript_18220/g.49699 Transcript_18220/m.49699 type:complete len:199 (-) Transcript_18220:129-725(-)